MTSKKKAKQKAHKHNQNAAAAVAPSRHSGQDETRHRPTQLNATEEVVPEQGWLVEFEQALQVVKTDDSAAARLRGAAAACKLRLWKKAKSACRKGLQREQEPEDSTVKKQLLHYQKNSDAEIDAYARHVAKHGEGERFAGVFANPDKFPRVEAIHVVYEAYGNLHLLQYAAITGNVYLLEQVVSAGAAIDYPVLDVDKPRPAPPGTTALLLLCLSMAFCGQVAAFPDDRDKSSSRSKKNVLFFL